MLIFSKCPKKCDSSTLIVESDSQVDTYQALWEVSSQHTLVAHQTQSGACDDHLSQRAELQPHDSISQATVSSHAGPGS